MYCIVSINLQCLPRPTCVEGTRIPVDHQGEYPGVREYSLGLNMVLCTRLAFNTVTFIPMYP